MAEAASPAAEASGPQLRREMGPIAVLFSSVGIVIGSGWLFGALHASETAGPAALISWLIGAVAMLILALTIAEMGGMYAVAGGLVRYPHFAFGSMAGFAAGWFYFMGGASTPPIETEAVLTYASGYVHGLITPEGVLIWPGGYVTAFVIMLIMTGLNLIGIRWMSEVNKYAVWWKIAVPCLAIVSIMFVSFHTQNFSDPNHGGFLPFGWKGVFSAVAVGGIVFSYTGFEGAVSFGAESKNPGRNIPIAVIGAMLIGFVIYFMLQVAFLGGLQPQNLAHGWTNISLGTSASGNAIAGPFVGIAVALGLGWLAIILYIDAIISPADTGLLSIGTGSRTVFALARNRYIPELFGRLNTFGVPWVAVLVTLIFGLILFGPFPSWGELVGFVSSASVLTYSLVPISLAALRSQDPDRPRPFKIPAAAVITPAAFIVANELILFSGFGVVWKVLVAVIIGVVVLAVGRLGWSAAERPNLDFRNSWWIAPWLVGFAIIAFLGSFQSAAPDPNTIPFTTIEGGTGKVLPFGIDMLVLAIWSLIIFYIALAVRLKPEQSQSLIDEFSAEASELPEVGH